MIDDTEVLDIKRDTEEEDLEFVIESFSNNVLDSTKSMFVYNENTEDIVSELSPFTLKLRINEFEDETKLNKFVKNCEKMIRFSPEYRIWTEYIHDVLCLHTCQVTGEDNIQTSVHVHHHPYTLFTIVKALILRKMTSNIEFCSFDISTEAIQLHYELKVPFCLLLSSMHEKYHNGFLEIPMELIHGDWNWFKDNLLQYIDSEEEIENITHKLSVNKNNCGWEKGYNWIKPITTNNITGD